MMDDDNPFEQIVGAAMAQDHREHVELVNAMNLLHHKATVASIDAGVRFVDAQTAWIKTAEAVTKLLALGVFALLVLAALWVGFRV